MTSARFHKLVRDGIPKIIRENGGSPVVRTLADREFKRALGKKLFEEIAEYLEARDRATRIEELADIGEVLRALAKIEGIKESEVASAMREKRKARGGFTKQLFLEKVD